MNDYTFEGEYAQIPQRMQEALLRYVKQGSNVGQFLRAVLTNDLFGTFAYADDENKPIIFLYIRWLYNEAPGGCFGGVGEFYQWQRKGGLIGHHKEHGVCNGS
jgi:hypothetical protein